MMAKRKPLPKKSAKLLKQGWEDVKAGRVSPVPQEVLEEPLTEKRVRELIAEELAKANPWTFRLPQIEEVQEPIPQGTYAYAAPHARPRQAMPTAVVLYMVQTYEPPKGFTSATITFTPPVKGGK